MRLAGSGWSDTEKEILFAFPPGHPSSDIIKALVAEGFQKRSARSIRSARYDYRDADRPPVVPDTPPAYDPAVPVCLPQRPSEAPQATNVPIPPPLLASTEKAANTAAWKVLFGDLRRAHQELVGTTEDKREAPRPTSADKAALVSVCGDWHVGERTTFNQRETYNVEIFRRRGKAILDHLYYESRDLIKHGTIDEICCCFTGDLHDSEDVYHGHANRLDQRVVGQRDALAEVLVPGLELLCSLGVPVTIAAVGGNHDHMGKRAGTASCLDALLFGWIDTIAAREGWGCKVIRPEEQFAAVSLKGQNGIIMHKGLASAQTSAADRWRLGQIQLHEDHGSGLDWFAGGHIHSTMVDEVSGRPFFRVGPLSGGAPNDLAVRIGKWSRPRQLAFTVDAEQVGKRQWWLEVE